MSRLNEEKLIAALLKHNTQRAAAAELGITERTVRRYMTDPAFMEKLNEQKRRILEKATDEIHAALTPSIKVLRDIVENKKAPKTAQVQAARTILEYSVKLGEYTDLDARITALEAQDEPTEPTEEI